MGTSSGCVATLRRFETLAGLAALAVAGTLLAACSSVAWTSTDADSVATRQDSIECRRLAGSEAWQQRWERDWPPAFYDSGYMPPYYRWSRPFWHGYPPSLELEQDLYEFCMHSKGYRRGELAY